MDVSIIIITYNTLRMTSDCLESIFEKTQDIKYEVILVDNASTDGSKEFFEKDSRIRYIYLKDNIGFGKANNAGYLHAKGKYVFLLNSDTILINNAVKEFFAFAERSKQYEACFGSILLNENLTPIHSCAKFPSLCLFLKKSFNLYTKAIGLDLLKEYYDKVPEATPSIVDYITGADLFIKREVIDKYGLFNPCFFMYYEETELQYRYRVNGYKSVIIDTPKIIHLTGKSYKAKRSLFKFRLINDSMIKYCKLCFSKNRYIATRFLNAAIAMPYVLLYPASLTDKKLTLKVLCGKFK